MAARMQQPIEAASAAANDKAHPARNANSPITLLTAWTHAETNAEARGRPRQLGRRRWRTVRATSMPPAATPRATRQGPARQGRTQNKNLLVSNIYVIHDGYQTIIYIKLKHSATQNVQRKKFLPKWSVPIEMLVEQVKLNKNHKNSPQKKENRKNSKQ